MLSQEQLQHIFAALQYRQGLLLGDCLHRGAWRLFNGFTEGVSDLVIDLLGVTAVIHDYAADCRDMRAVADVLCSQLEFVQSILLKRRNSDIAAERNGMLLKGQKTVDRVEEHGVKYAIDPAMNHDNGFYADTRLLRKYLLENMAGKRVLNTFAYTGSLGVAAAVGGAEYVLQTDLSGKFMSQAYRSASLNGFAFTRKNFRVGDFFPVTAALRREKSKFDCVIVDPPFFSTTSRGVVDLARDPLNVINKVRPLVADNGVLIVVNNSLYLPGRDFLQHIESLCGNGFLELETVIPVPEDFCRRIAEAQSPYPADPQPFNHPTKIVVLRVHC